ncbi:MAG: peptidoglycan-binding domain-containing protein, partial [Halobacteriota archaeon]
IPLPPNQIFRPDGVAGPITVRAIEHFQEVGRGRGNDITVDGRVDKASGTGFGTISNTQFTILFLNNAYRKIRVDVFQNISILAGDCPPELRSALSLG